MTNLRNSDGDRPTFSESTLLTGAAFLVAALGLAFFETVKQIGKIVRDAFVQHGIKHVAQSCANVFLLLAGPLHERGIRGAPGAILVL